MSDHRGAPAATATDATMLVAQAQILELIVGGRALREVLDALCLLVEQQASEPVRAAIMLVDPSTQRLYTGGAPSLPVAYAAALDGVPLDPGVATCVAAAARGETIDTPDIAADPGWAALRHLPLAHGLVAARSVPILAQDGAVLGTFGTYFLTPRTATDHERNLVAVLARTAGLAIERDRADSQLRAVAERQRFLAELASATQPLVEATEVMAASARLLAEHLGVDRCAYADIEDERVFNVSGDYARGVRSIVGRWDVAAFGPACEDAMRRGAPYVVEDAAADPRIDDASRAAYIATEIRAVICLPLYKGGVFTAAMAVHQKVPRAWTATEIELVEIVVSRCWEALERTRITRDLRESEARYRAIVETTPECVKVLDNRGNVLQVNAAGARMLEIPSADLAVGASIYDVIVPEHRDAFRGLNERVCRGERGVLEFDLVGLAGTRRSMETTAVPLPSSTGDGFLHLAIARDVTARVAADRALAESRGRLDYAVRLSGVGFWYCDLPFDELIWDERVKAHFFLPPDTRVTIDLFYERIHPDDREPTQAAIARSIDEHGSYDVVYRTCEPNTGRMKWIRALGGTAYALDGTPLRFDGVTLDVTAQRRDQERLEGLAAAALTIHSAASLEDLLRVVTDEARGLIGVHQAIATLARDANDGAVCEAVSLSDRYAADYQCCGAATTSRLYTAVTTANRPVRLTAAELEAWPVEDRPRATGCPPMRGWLAVPLVSRTGANLGVIQLSDKQEDDFCVADEAILVQLAQLASVAIENARLAAQLRDQDRRKDEFLATLAHELRNPLAPIRTGVQLLALGVSPDRAARALEMMERQLVHLVHMVDDLLDISRVTLGKVTLKRERVDLRTVLDSAIESTRALVDANGHELVVRLGDQPLPLYVDPTRMSQVFANLINNAAKYTPKGGRIVVATDQVGPYLQVKVSDTGVGIPADMLAGVFEMFTQVGRSIDRSQGGLGIGLTLVRRLVEMHGGSVSADSPGLNRGSTFVVRVPLEAPLDEAADRRPAAAAAPGAEVEPLRILVVDDNVDGAETLAMMLELGGNFTRLAATGESAIAEASAFRPHVVFLDIGLPDLNGYEVARQLRLDPTLPRPLLVALTGWGTEDDRRQAREAGFDNHLVKPVDFDRVKAVLARARAGSRGPDG